MNSEITKPPDKSLSRQIFEALLYLIGCLLIFGGLAVLIWILRPYAMLYLMPSAKANLEKKAKAKTMQGNYIIIPSVLVDAPISEGVTGRTLSTSVGHLVNSARPGEKGNCILEGHNLAEFGLFRPMSFFSLLEVIKPEGKVYVFYSGKKFIYQVKDKKVLDVSNPELSRITNYERLTLISCVSTWSATIYTKKRTVVICLPIRAGRKE